MKRFQPCDRYLPMAVYIFFYTFPIFLLTKSAFVQPISKSCTTLHSGHPVQVSHGGYMHKVDGGDDHNMHDIM